MRRVIAAALFLDALVGDPARFHPVAGFGAVAAAAEERDWRDSRLAGALHASALVGAVVVAAALAERRLRRGRGAFAAVALWVTLGGQSLGDHACACRDAVAGGDIPRARELARGLVGRDVSVLDAAGLCRAAVESVAENTTDAVVAPLLWYCAAGTPGAVGYRAANTLDAMIGHRSARYERFGWFAARLDDALTFVPARFAATAAVVLASLAGRHKAALAALPAATAHPSPNAGLIEAAFAGALGVRLGGRTVYGRRVEDRPAFGPPRLPQPNDITRAVRLSRLVTLAVASFLSVFDCRR